MRGRVRMLSKTIQTMLARCWVLRWSSDACAFSMRVPTALAAMGAQDSSPVPPLMQG